MGGSVKKDVKIIIKASLANNGRTRATISGEDLEGLNHEERERLIDELAEEKGREMLEVTWEEI